MAINTLEYATVFQGELDRQMVQAATSGWMEENAGAVQYSGGSDVKIPSVTMNGMADYDRDTGFVQGAVTLSYETKTMTQDRGRTFHLDAMDVNETNFVLSAAGIMAQYQAEKVVPEVDAYRYCTIAAQAVAATRVTDGYTPAAATILDTLRKDLYSIWDEIGEGTQLVISISTMVAMILDSTEKIQRNLSVADFRQGEVNLKLKTLDDVPMIRVPSKRMYTAFDFADGKTAGQEAGGFAPSVDAQKINWIITARRAPIAVSKTDTVRIFDPMTTQNAHAWKIDYRKYHDLWITAGKMAGVWVNTQANA